MQTFIDGFIAQYKSRIKNNALVVQSDIYL